MPDEATLEGVVQEVSALRDLFSRRLLEDRVKARLYEDLRAQIAFAQEGLARTFLRPLYGEILLVVDRMRSQGEDDLAASVVAELEEILHRRGVRRVAAAEVFDPALHEAMRSEPSATVPRGGLIAVLRDGYVLDAELLRPVAVVVSAGLAGTEPATLEDEVGDADG